MARSAERSQLLYSGAGFTSLCVAGEESIPPCSAGSPYRHALWAGRNFCSTGGKRESRGGGERQYCRALRRGQFGIGFCGNVYDSFAFFREGQYFGQRCSIYLKRVAPTFRPARLLPGSPAPRTQFAARAAATKKKRAGLGGIAVSQTSDRSGHSSTGPTMGGLAGTRATFLFTRRQFPP